jgi:hypothetical protein
VCVQDDILASRVDARQYTWPDGAEAPTPGRFGSQRACLGRLYFHLPEGIGLGPYSLGVKFAHTMVRVPFRIMTKDEARELEKKLDEKGS